MRSLTCIVCPIGCSLDVNESGGIENQNEADISVTGNRCARGVVYAIEEIRAPKRIVTATVSSADAQDSKQTIFSNSIKRIPVKTSSPCLREKIPSLLRDIYKIKLNLPVKAGDIVIENWNNEGIDVIATRTVNIEQ